jgi:hypothetical protein
MLRDAIQADTLFVCQPAHRLVPGANRPSPRRRCGPERCDVCPVPGEVGQVFGQVSRVRRLDGDRDRSVQRDAVSAVEGTLDRVTRQRVHEPVAPDVVAGAIDEAVADGLIGDVEQADVAPAERRADDGEREVAPDDRRYLEEIPAVGRNRAETSDDKVANGRRWRLARPGAVGQRTGKLADEERVPAGHVGDLGSPVVGDADIDDQRKLGADVLLGEATQVQPRCPADAKQTSEVAAQRRLWFRVAGRHDDHQRQVGDPIRDVPQQQQ